MTWLLMRLVRLFNAQDAMVRDYARTWNCFGGIVAPSGEVVPVTNITPMQPTPAQPTPAPAGYEHWTQEKKNIFHTLLNFEIKQMLYAMTSTDPIEQAEAAIDEFYGR